MFRNEKISHLTDQLQELGMPVMAASLAELYHSKDFPGMDSLSLLETIIEPQYSAAMTRKVNNRLKNAHLAGSPADIANCVDSNERSYLPKDLPGILSSLVFIQNGMNLCILGPSDSGKTYLAKAIGILACGTYRVAYHHAEKVMEELVAVKQEDFKKYQRRMKSLCTVDLLILDDFLLHTISDEREVKVLHELLEMRSELTRSVIVCSQRDPKSWTSMILNDEVSSNALLKRVTKHYTLVICPKEVS